MHLEITFGKIHHYMAVVGRSYSKTIGICGHANVHFATVGFIFLKKKSGSKGVSLMALGSSAYNHLSIFIGPLMYLRKSNLHLCNIILHLSYI